MLITPAGAECLSPDIEGSMESMEHILLELVLDICTS